MKIINVAIDDKRWAQIKEIADGERRHIKHQAALVLEQWVDFEVAKKRGLTSPTTLKTA